VHGVGEVPQVLTGLHRRRGPAGGECSWTREWPRKGLTRLTYEIKEGKGGVTTLTVTHDLTGAPKLAALLAGAMESRGAGGGWSYVLSGLKTLLETGKSLDWPG
jgi:hypothetical protein